MNKLGISINDSVAIQIERLKAIGYLLKSEVNSFIESLCPENHIFISAIIAGELWNASESSNVYKIYQLTHDLLESFDEDKADELLEIIDMIDLSDIEEEL